jgi:RNA polymerase sigma-70 factor (ECF subfamily)
MNESQWLADRFEEQRPHLRAVAYRMLGSLAEADDAVQDAWLRVSDAGASGIENISGWLTTVVARISLNRLRTRRRHREDSLDARLPDPIISSPGSLQPEDEALMADSVGLALLIVLDTLTPAERLAFVLHDVFEMSFEDIAPMVGRTPQAARQLASRGRRRVKSAAVREPDVDLVGQRTVVDAFFRAARSGDFEALVAVLDPDVVLRGDYGIGRPLEVLRGIPAVASRARGFKGAVIHSVIVNGLAGAVITAARERPFAVMAFTVVGGRIVEIDAIADQERVARIAAIVLKSLP